MKDPSRRSLCKAALRRTARDPVWLGHWLARHRRHELLTTRQQAWQLGTSIRGLVLLSLCRTPAEGSFVDDLDAVCLRTGANKFQLARILRQEQALADWHASPPNPRGWLAAAADAPTDDVRSVDSPPDPESAHEPPAS